jgi:Protein of unknown function (DUF3037)
MLGHEAYQYALWRLVADLERGEVINAGVLLFCRRRSFLEARVHVDAAKLSALAPELDPRVVTDHLAGLVRVAAGDPAAGEIARAPQSERFHWLVAPASTIVQPGPVHTGLCDDPAALLDRLFARLVL